MGRIALLGDDGAYGEVGHGIDDEGIWGDEGIFMTGWLGNMPAPVAVAAEEGSFSGVDMDGERS